MSTAYRNVLYTDQGYTPGSYVIVMREEFCHAHCTTTHALLARVCVFMINSLLTSFVFFSFVASHKRTVFFVYLSPFVYVHVETLCFLINLKVVCRMLVTSIIRIISSLISYGGS